VIQTGENERFFINTPLQRGDSCAYEIEKLFQQFPGLSKTVETVSAILLLPFTLLKQGANESNHLPMP
jgi:hypothetical protein